MTSYSPTTENFVMSNINVAPACFNALPPNVAIVVFGRHDLSCFTSSAACWSPECSPAIINRSTRFLMFGNLPTIGFFTYLRVKENGCCCQTKGLYCQIYKFLHFVVDYRLVVFTIRNLWMEKLSLNASTPHSDN